MNDSTNVVLQTVSGLLDELGTRFGATGAHLWEQLVRYEVVQAVAGTVAVAGAWGVAGVLLVVGVKKDIEELFIPAGIAFAILSLIGVLSLPWAIGAMLVPEASVLNGLLP